MYWHGPKVAKECTYWSKNHMEQYHFWQSTTVIGLVLSRLTPKIPQGLSSLENAQNCHSI